MALVVGPNNKTADVVAINGSFAGMAHNTRMVMDATAIAYAPGDARPDDYLVVENGRRLAVWNLTHTEVSFSRATGDLKITDNYKEFDDLPISPASNAEWKDIRWLANASRASADDSNDDGRFVDPDFLKPHAHLGSSCSNPTDALIRLRNGEVLALSPNSEKLQTYSVKFEDGTMKDYQRSITDRFSVVIPFADAPTIVLKTFGGSSRQIHINGAKDQTIFFSTLPSSDETSGQEVQVIPHFQAVYSLLKDPLRKRKAGFMRGIGSTECPPAMARAK
jgi:hypothetical protein